MKKDILKIRLILGGIYMLNQVVLVGRIVRDPEIYVTKTGRKFSYLTLAINRTFKNPTTGLYDTDFISVTLWEKVAVNVVNHCKKGTVIGVKGRLTTRPNDDPAIKNYLLEVVAERVSFISQPYHSNSDEAEDIVLDEEHSIDEQSPEDLFNEQ